MVVVVGIGHVAGGRHQERGLRPADLARRPARRPDEERDVVLLAAVLGVAAPDMRGIGAAAAGRRARVSAKSGCQPASYRSSSWKWIAPYCSGRSVQRIVSPRPVPALHRARRQVDQLAVAARAARGRPRGWSRCLARSPRRRPDPAAAPPAAAAGRPHRARPARARARTGQGSRACRCSAARPLPSAAGRPAISKVAARHPRRDRRRSR